MRSALVLTPFILLALPLVGGPLVGCGHISNVVLDEDQTFLSILPDEAHQALVGPESDVGGGARAPSTLSPGGLLLLSPFDAGLGAAGRDRLTTPGTEPEAGAVNPETAVVPVGHRPGEAPEWSDPSHTSHGGADVEPSAIPRFAPVAQAAEMFAQVGGSIDLVIGAADLLRSVPPTDGDSEGRHWQGLSWSGGSLDGTTASAGDGTYRWSLAGADGAMFAEGEADPRPTAETGQGAWTLDQDALAAAFPVDAAGQMAVAWDNRVGVELLLALEGTKFPDGGSDCDRQAPSDSPGCVVVGPSQSYVLVDGVGDYQFTADRERGPGEWAHSEVRVRWTEAGGRADTIIRMGVAGAAPSVQVAAEWRWSQCWVGALDTDALVYDHLEVRTRGVGESVERDAGGVDACAYPDLGRVDRGIGGGPTGTP